MVQAAYNDDWASVAVLLSKNRELDINDKGMAKDGREDYTHDPIQTSVLKELLATPYEKRRNFIDALISLGGEEKIKDIKEKLISDDPEMEKTIEEARAKRKKELEEDDGSDWFG